MKETLVIKKLGINGEGIGYINKKICFIDGALPDEEVEITITENNKKYYKAELDKIIKPSPYRKKVNEEYRKYLGCKLMHLDYDHQLLSKKQWIVDALNKYTTVSTNLVKDVIGADHIYNYRNIVRLPIAYFNGQLHVGIYERESHYFTIMDDFILQNKTINKVIREVLDIFNNHGLKDYYDKFKTGLRFIEMRCVEDKVQILMICGKNGINEEVLNEIKEIKEVISVFYSINTSRQDFKLVGYKKIYGESKLVYNLNGIKLVHSIKADFPLNLEMEEVKNKVILSLINKEKSILYINGQTALPLTLTQNVTCITDDRYIYEDAKNNIKFLKKENVDYIYGDIGEEAIKKCKKDHYDMMIYTSTSRNMNEDVMDSLIKSKIRTLIYVTPHYSTMAREIASLKNYYSVKSITPIDYEPHTSQVLCILKLVRK